MDRLDHPQPSARRAGVRAGPVLLRSCCGGQRYSSGEGGVCFTVWVYLCSRDDRQVFPVRDTDRVRRFAGSGGPDSTHLRGCEQSVGAGCAAEPGESAAHDLGRHGSWHCRGLQCADCGRHLYAGRTDRRPGPDDALGRDCGSGLGCGGGAHHHGSESHLSRATGI